MVSFYVDDRLVTFGDNVDIKNLRVKLEEELEMSYS